MTVWSYCLELQMQNNLDEADDEIELICSHLSKSFSLWGRGDISKFLLKLIKGLYHQPFL